MSGGDYRRWEQQGYQVIVRLNNGYGADGTIPTPDKYADFARRCANYIRNSPGCTHWIIGNEPNHAQERPQGSRFRRRSTSAALCRWRRQSMRVWARSTS